MRFLELSALALLSLANQSPALASTLPAPTMSGAGTVAIVEGNAYVQRGSIYFTRPRVGAEVKVNKFGQYADDAPEPAYVKWVQNTRRHLKPNDQIQEGEIIQTMGDAWLKILFNDDSLLDIGPAAMVQVEKFVGTGKDRQVIFKVLYGKVRGVVAQELRGPSRYQILTPTALMGVRGTEYLVDVTPDGNNRSQTQIVCLHGQVSVDVTKHNDRGEIYTHPVVVNPGSTFATGGFHGLGQTVTMQALPQAELAKVVAKISPAVNQRATVVGAHPMPNRMPGTGLKMAYIADTRAPRRLSPEKNINSFDMDHPPADRVIASASGNFNVPHDFRPDPGAFGGMRDFRKITGPSPINLLPATTSRVTVNLIGAD